MQILELYEISDIGRAVDVLPVQARVGARSKHLVTVVMENDSKVWPMICR